MNLSPIRSANPRSFSDSSCDLSQILHTQRHYCLGVFLYDRGMKQDQDLSDLHKAPLS
jgi:hypothetical protein